MICYLWFAPSPAKGDATSDGSPAASGDGREREGRERGERPSALQLTASPTFVAFTQKLETTQVDASSSSYFFDLSPNPSSSSPCVFWAGAGAGADNL
ncbi:hypothetical protein B0H13DRAFT_2363432 [Mycena leptocephala]|nr:hypothetical protein B0H13DRAFT_2363432 [Mycena leptocephala]